MPRQDNFLNNSHQQIPNKDSRLNFSQSYNRLNQSQVIQITNNSQTLNPNFISAIKTKTSRSNGGQRLKLIDYISLKNTAKQYGTNNKKIKSDIDLRKSQMKDNKAKAFALFVKDMEKQFDIIQAVMPELKKQVGQNIGSDGNTSDVAKVCAIRRILKEKILGAIQEIRKLNGTQEKNELKITRKLTAQQQEDALDNKLVQLGLSRVESQSNINQQMCESIINQQEDFKITVNGK